jgi:hypothetical protein
MDLPCPTWAICRCQQYQRQYEYAVNSLSHDQLLSPSVFMPVWLMKGGLPSASLDGTTGFLTGSWASQQEMTHVLLAPGIIFKYASPTGKHRCGSASGSLSRMLLTASSFSHANSHDATARTKIRGSACMFDELTSS